MIFKSILLLILILVIIVCIVSLINLTYRKFINESIKIKETVSKQDIDLITENDLKHLPPIIKDYLKYVGVIGKPKVYSYDVLFDGDMKLDKTVEFAPITAQQKSYNPLSKRLFYITMKYKHLKIVGLHHFEDGIASMVIKILDIFKVVNVRGGNGNKAETVTIFNDMCLLAPPTLIDKRIKWEELDELSVKGTFTNEGISISAVLTFDEESRLINFISNDRYFLDNQGEMLNVPWSTPIYEYKEINGYNLISKGDAVWHFEDGGFTYLRLFVVDVKYNVV